MMRGFPLRSPVRHRYIRTCVPRVLAYPIRRLSPPSHAVCYFYIRNARVGPFGKTAVLVRQQFIRTAVLMI